ncbi:hypothetical protein PMIT1323_01762 [Prochlorococcus marinus str. MIT 1323]|nr:hypothetical protein PMIT1323_01762 [Prochlorococcus marinus str. MIT 1323]
MFIFILLASRGALRLSFSQEYALNELIRLLPPPEIDKSSDSSSSSESDSLSKKDSSTDTSKG